MEEWRQRPDRGKPVVVILGTCSGRISLPTSWEVRYNVSMETQQEQPTVARYIEHRTTRAGERKAYVIGTRLAVENVYVCHELQGMSPDEIVAAYPHLTLAQVHAALAYFFDHSEEVRRQLRRSEEFATQSETEQDATKFTLLRNTILGAKDGANGDSPAS